MHSMTVDEQLALKVSEEVFHFGAFFFGDFFGIVCIMIKKAPSGKQKFLK